MKKSLPIILVLILIAVASLVWKFDKNEVKKTVVTNFEECIAEGNPVMESYPRQCRNGEQLFTEDIGNELDKTNLIRLDHPRPNQIITSPLAIKGQARGNWFFEASFPVVLTDWDGKIIAEGIAQAKSDWMTTEFVPFEATLKFVVDKNVYRNNGSLILKKDNPSGLPEHDDALEIPVIFAGVTGVSKGGPVACTMDAKMCPDGSYVGRTGSKCEFSDCPTESVETSLTAKLNQKIKYNGVYITPTEVISDSRCPTDVECFWAGEILVKIKLEKGDISKVVELKEGQNTSIGGSVVILESALPEKKSTTTIQEGDYMFTFRVE